MLMAYIRSSVSDPSTADDIWQETMLVAWRRIEDFDRSKPFGPWLRGIAAKTILARRRASSKYILLEDDHSLEYLSSRFESIQKLVGDTLEEKLDALRNCVERLPEGEQTCIRMRYVDGLMPQELSHRLQLGLETVKKRLVRARQRLSECLNRKLALEGSEHVAGS